MGAVFIPTRARLTVDQFHRMGEAGILAANDRIELIDGELIEMAPIGSKHAWAVDELANSLRILVGSTARVSTQNPLQLSAQDEPQPDLMLLQPKAYREALPKSADVLALIEVSDTSIDYDRNVKLALYARYGVCEVWIVDLQQRRLELYREPQDGRYRVKLERGAADSVSPQALPELVVKLSTILT